MLNKIISNRFGTSKFILAGVGLVCIFAVYLIAAATLHLVPFNQHQVRAQSSDYMTEVISDAHRVEVVGWLGSHRPEEALPYADLVVLAEITQVNDARWNTPDGLKPSQWEHTAEFISRWLIYTPFEFKIIKVLKGDAPDQAVSEFAVLGGRVGDDIVDANEPINLYSDVAIGDQMILFLGQSTSDLVTVAPYTYVDALRVDHNKATVDCRGSRAADDCRVAFELSDVLAKIEASKGSKQ